MDTAYRQETEEAVTLMFPRPDGMVCGQSSSRRRTKEPDVASAFADAFSLFALATATWSV